MTEVELKAYVLTRLRYIKEDVERMEENPLSSLPAHVECMENHLEMVRATLAEHAETPD